MFQQHKGLISLISNATIDFTPQDFNLPLTLAQQRYLKELTGRDIPQVFWRQQVHRDTIILVKGNAASCQDHPDADAFITNKKNVPIAIRTADCVPVFIYDAAKKVIGLAHAGWKGTHQEITKKTITKMQENYGSQWHDVWVYLGPAIRSCCYTVGHEFKAYFPQDAIDHDDGHISVDIIKANCRQIMQMGLNPLQVIDSEICTSCNHNYFSYRRDKEKAGRMISLMMLT